MSWAWAQELRPRPEGEVLACNYNKLGGFARFRKEPEFNVTIVCAEILFDRIECFSFMASYLL